MFRETLIRAEPRIPKSTQWGHPLDPELKLAITLRVFATGIRLAFNIRVQNSEITN